MPNDTTANVAEFGPGSKEKAVYWLKSLIELIENDQIAAGEIMNLTAVQVIARAEDEAAKAVEGSERLKNS